MATLWNPRGLQPHPHLLRASTEKPKGHDTHSGSRGHLLVGDVKMLSHGLGSGRHGDCLFKFAFRIQPEFSGDLSRTNTNTLVLPSKGGPATGQVFGSRSTCRPRCQRPVGRTVFSPVGDGRSAHSRRGCAKIKGSRPLAPSSAPRLSPEDQQVHVGLGLVSAHLEASCFFLSDKS